MQWLKKILKYPNFDNILLEMYVLAVRYYETGGIQWNSSLLVSAVGDVPMSLAQVVPIDDQWLAPVIEKEYIFVLGEGIIAIGLMGV